MIIEGNAAASRRNDARENRDAIDEARAPASQENSAEAVMAKVIGNVLDGRPRGAAKHYYHLVTEGCERSSVKPPSLASFLKSLSAERSRRKALILEASARAADRVGAAVGDRWIELLPGAAPIGRRDFEVAVASLAGMRSACLSDAFRDYCDASRRAGEKTMPEETFRALVLSDLFVSNVPHGLMSDWWRRKLARAGK